MKKQEHVWKWTYNSTTKNKESGINQDWGQLILLVFKSAQSLATHSKSIESVKSFSHDIRSNDSNRWSPIVVRNGVFTIFSRLNVRSSFATVTGMYCHQ